MGLLHASNHWHSFDTKPTNNQENFPKYQNTAGEEVLHRSEAKGHVLSFSIFVTEGSIVIPLFVEVMWGLHSELISILV